MLTAAFAAALVSFAHLPGASAQAADAADPRVDQARRFFDDAERDFAAERFLPAARGYQRAYDLLREAGRPTAPLVLYNVGRAYDRGDRPTEAIEAYRRFLREAAARDAETERWRATAQDRLGILAPGASNDETTPPSSNSGSGGSISPVGPIVLASGAAFLVAGLVLGGVALAEDATVNDACPSREDCDPEVRGAFDNARTLSAVGDVLWIAGAAVAATGLVLTLVLTEGEDAPTARLGCGPVGCLATLRGSF